MDKPTTNRLRLRSQCHHVLYDGNDGLENTLRQPVDQKSTRGTVTLIVGLRC
jgi:hypothetical protein